MVPPNVDIYVSLNVFRFINGVYNVPNSTHILYWRTLTGGVWTNKSYSVQVGNWNITDLIANLNAGQADLVFVYDSKTFRVSVSFSGAYTQVEILSSANNINARLGFSETTSTTILPAQSVTGSNLIDLLGMQNIYINIDDLQVGSNSTLGYGNSNVLDHIAVVVPQGVGQTYNGNGLMLKCGVRKITQLRVQLFTGEGILAELNNTEWYLSLLFNFQYENEFKPARYLTDVNGDGRIDLQDVIQLYQQQQQQRQQENPI
jgi:hypothetical protein